MRSIRTSVFALLCCLLAAGPIASAQEIPDPAAILSEPSLLHPDEAATVLVAQLLGGQQLPGELGVQLLKFLQENEGGSDLLDQFSVDFVKKLLGNVANGGGGTPNLGSLPTDDLPIDCRSIRRIRRRSKRSGRSMDSA